MITRLTSVLKSIFTVEDASWEYTEEPHTSRRKEILKKYPEVKKLMGHDHLIAYIVLVEVFIQFCMMWVVRDMAWGPLFILSYVVSGTINHSLAVSIHEIGHNLVYGHDHPIWNRALGIIVNLPLVHPISITYKKYHSDHHRYLCDPQRDVGVPSTFECLLFRHLITRIFWLIALPILLAVRPFNRRILPVQKLEVLNLIIQFAFDAAVLYFLGTKSLLYCIGGTLLGMGLHPLTGQFITEHFLDSDGLATSSYYGPFNYVLFNVGYHVEHHDFPYIPWHRLPQLRRIAPEFYDDLPQHTSCFYVLWTFIITGPQGLVLSDLNTMTKKIT